MTLQKPEAPSRRAAEPVAVWLALPLAMLGALTVGVPYIGHAVGLSVDVAGRVEVVDHVVPGAVVAAVGGYLFRLARRRPVLGSPAALLGSSVSFLAGFWILATHVPLMIDAAQGKAAWGATAWHASTSLPIVALSLWYLTRR